MSGSPPAGSYFSHVDLVFHNVGLSPHNVVLSLDTTGYGINDGFAFAPLSVPEPATWGLLAVACMVMGASRHRRA